MTSEMLAIVLGGVVGLSLGALGGGGSTLAVPILVFVAGLSAQDATSASLLVVGVAALFGVASHVRAGHVRVAAGVAFGAAGIAGSRLGLAVNRAMDEGVLLLAFSVLVGVVALRMWRSADADPVAQGEAHTAPQASDGAVATRQRAAVSAPTAVTVSSVVRLAMAATIVGALTGLFGVGGGFAVVPALTLLLGFSTRDAVGTSLLVIAVNAAVALVLRSGDLGFDWALVGPFLATVTVGVLGGARVARRTEPARLTRAFAVMLGAVALYTAASTAVLA